MIVRVRQDWHQAPGHTGQLNVLTRGLSVPLGPDQSPNAVVVLELHVSALLPRGGGARLGTGVPVCHVLGVSGHQARARAGRLVFALLAVEVTDGVLAVDLHVFPERGRMCVGLVAASHLAVVGLVTGVDM